MVYNIYMKKIGILGGTFDPIHNGHIYLAKTAMEKCSLSKVVFLPLGIPPHKNAPIADAHTRYELIKKCIKDIPDFCLCDIEIKKQNITYTVDTLRDIKSLYPDWDIYYIIGTDSLFDLEKWKNINKIFKMCSFICMSRPGEDFKYQESFAKELETKYKGNIIVIPTMGKNISSTTIRSSPSNELDHLVPVQITEQVRKIYAKEENIINRQELLERLKPLISEERFKHTLSTEKTAVELAQIHGCDKDKASLAALLHDCAKRISKNPEEFCKEHNLSSYLHDYDDYPLPVLHAPMGAHLAKEEFGVTDPEVLSAITWHTSGKPNMSLMDKIIYLADYTEPGRYSTPQLEEVRSLSKTNLDKAMVKALEYSIERIKSKGNPVHYTTLNAYKYMKEQTKE